MHAVMVQTGRGWIRNSWAVFLWMIPRLSLYCFSHKNTVQLVIVGIMSTALALLTVYVRSRENLALKNETRMLGLETMFSDEEVVIELNG